MFYGAFWESHLMSTRSACHSLRPQTNFGGILCPKPRIGLLGVSKVLTAREIPKTPLGKVKLMQTS